MSMKAAWKMRMTGPGLVLTVLILPLAPVDEDVGRWAEWSPEHDLLITVG
jgi:hypothetical protein